MFTVRLRLGNLVMTIDRTTRALARCSTKCWTIDPLRLGVNAMIGSDVHRSWPASAIELTGDREESLPRCGGGVSGGDRVIAGDGVKA